MPNNTERGASASKEKPQNLCAQFLEWVDGLGFGNFLYRGVSVKSRRSAEASICRRFRDLTDEKDKSSEQILQIRLPKREKFITATEQLLEDARMQGYDKNMSVLELLAELQHYGAATCLVDFTKNPLIALYFACYKNSGKNGKVAAFDDSASQTTATGTDELDKTVSELLSGKTIWTWEPKKQNQRIIAQQSVFVFGTPEIKILREHEYTVSAKDKAAILIELERYGFSEKSLFPDFDGFAGASNAHNKKYPAQNERDYFVAGQRQYQAQNYALAIENYTRAIGKKPEYAAAYYWRGRAKVALNNDWQGAVSNYSEAIKYQYPGAGGYFSRALAKYHMGKYKSAIADYDEAIKQENRLAPAYFGRGNTQSALNKHQAAIGDYSNAIKYDPDYAEAYNNRGIALRRLKKYDDAGKDHDMALEINPDFIDAFNSRGITKGMSGDNEGAVRDLSVFIEHNPQNANARYNRATGYRLLEKYEESLADYDEVNKLNPGNPIVLYYRGGVKYNLGDKAGAKADFEEAHRLNPKFKIPDSLKDKPKKNGGKE